MRRWVTTVLVMAAISCGALPVGAQAVPGAFLLYPNYRGMIFDDRPEIVVEAPSGATVTVTDQASGQSVAQAQSDGSPVKIPAAGLAYGQNHTVTAQNGSGVLGTWTVALARAADRASMNVSFDPQGRLLLKGVPRFGLGVYDSGLSYYNDAGSYEQAIFAAGGPRGLDGIQLNLYLNYHYGEAAIGPMLALMDSLQNHGMMYLQTANCFAAGSYTRIPFSVDQSDAYATQFGAHPGAAGYYIMDECVDGLVPETTQHHTRLAGLDKDSMTLAATLARGYIDPRKWTESADVVGTDPYPLFGAEPAQGYTHFQVADFVAQAKQAVRDTRPVFSVLQFFKFTTDSRWPSASEQRAHAVMSIVEGARGLFWWEIGQNGLQKSDAATRTAQMANLRRLVNELATLESVLVSDDVPGALVGNSTLYGDPLAGRKSQLQYDIAVEWLFSNKEWYQAELTRLNAGDTSRSPMLPGAATIRTKVKVVDGRGYVFAYNYTNTSTPVTFTWQTAPGSVTENSDGRSFAVSGNDWSDTLGPYESRIYVIANGGSGGGGGGGTPPPPAPAPLALAITSPPSGATVSGTASVTMSATGGTGPYTYTLAADGTTVATGASATASWNTTAVADGSHTLTATVTDSASATATASVTVTVANTTPPPGPTPSFTVSFQYPADGATVGGSQSVGLATTAPWGSPKTWKILVDGTLEVLNQPVPTGSTYWISWDTTQVANGSHTLTAMVIDGAGATATATRAVTVSNAGAPNQPPPPAPLAVSFTSPPSGATLTGAIGVTLAATGGTGPYTYALAVDGTTVSNGSASFNWNTTTVANGAHTLTASVTDSTGATATSSLAVSVLNLDPLAASFSAPANGATVSGAVTVGMAAAGAYGGATFKLAVDGTEVSSQAVSVGTASYAWNTIGIANGTHTLGLTVTDGAGRTATSSLAVSVLNLDPLAASFSAPANGATVSGTTTVGMAATGAYGGATFKLAVDGTEVSSQAVSGGTASYAWNTVGISNGTHTLGLTVTDGAGRTATSSLTVSVLNLDPLAASFSAPASGATVSGAVTVGMTATGASGGSTFKLAIDGTEVSSQAVSGTTASYAWNTIGIANGTHTLGLTVTDGAGRTATSSLTVSVLNLDPLAASFSAPANGATVSGAVTVGMAAAGASGGSTFKLAIDGTEVSSQAVSGTTASYAWNTIGIANGTHTLGLTVTDGAGRTATSSLAVSVLNLDPLAASFSAPANGATVSGTVTVGMGATGAYGGATFKLAIDGTEVSSQSVASGTTASYAWNTTGVANGSHTLTLTVTDGAGRTATASVTVSVSNFTVSFQYPVEGATVSGSQSVGLATTAPWGAPKTWKLSVNGTEVLNQPVATGSTYWTSLDTTKVPNGIYTLTAMVVDGAGTTATANRAVTVSNSAPAPAPVGVSFTAPASGVTVSGTTTVGMSASGTSGTSNTFRLSVDGTVVSTQTVSGTTASYAWSTTGVANGTRTLAVTVTDASGRTATTSRTVTVSNPTQTATYSASFQYPSAGATVGGTQSVGMATTAPWGAVKTWRLLVDGSVVLTQTVQTGSTLWYSLNTRAFTNGSHTLMLTVTDAAGNVAVATRAVTVRN